MKFEALRAQDRDIQPERVLLIVPVKFSDLFSGLRIRMLSLAALQLLTALTEGIGLILLLPLLTVAGMGNLSDSNIAFYLTLIGIPIQIGPLLALFVAVIICRAGIGYARDIAAFRFEIRIIDGLRQRAWNALLHCDWRVLGTMRHSDSASLLISNIGRIGEGLNRALAGVATAFTLGALGLAGLAIAPRVVLAVAVASILVMVAYRGIRRRATLLGEGLSIAYAKVFEHMQENLAALRVIKSFGREDRAERDLINALATLRESQISYLQDVGRGRVVLHIGGALVLSVSVWIAIVEWQVSTVTILPMIVLFARALPMLGTLLDTWQNWEYARPAIGATLRLIEQAEASREPEFDLGSSGLEHYELHQAVTLSDVTVRFPGRRTPALEKVNLTIPVRGLVALTGPSGSGKSTLADVIGGLISPDEGAMMIDDFVLTGDGRRNWRKRVAYVQQEPILFSGTIRENLQWAVPQTSEHGLWQALEDASAHFVRKLPDGLDTFLGERGRQLSGGECQRIVLARALLRDPDLIILDEATSALDQVNEQAIVTAIKRLKSRLAIVVICHRGSLVAIADSVINMDDGRVVSEQMNNDL